MQAPLCSALILGLPQPGAASIELCQCHIPKFSHPLLMQLHVEVPVAHTVAGVIAGAQVLPHPQIPEPHDWEGLGIRVEPEAEDALQLVPLLELWEEQEMGNGATQLGFC